MTTIFVDENGDPILSPTGQILQITGDTELRHRIMNIFATPKGSEPFFQDYGFDYQKLYQNISLEPNLRLYDCVNDALDPDKIMHMSALHSVMTDVVDGVGYVDFVIINGREIPLRIENNIEMNI